MAAPKAFGTFYLTLSLASHFHHGRITTEALCQTSECQACNASHAVCRLCPNDPEIPGTLTELTLLAGNCRALEDQGILRELMVLRYTQLEKLTLDNMNIKLFSGPVFKNNGNLKALSVAHNPIMNFTNQTFQGLVNLEYLSMEQSNIVQLIPASFTPLTSLKTLNLAGNKLTKLAAHAFDGLGNLEHLNLSNNPITAIEVDTFKPLVKATNISMDGMALTGIPPGLFRDLSSLRRVNLRGNQIDIITAQYFNNVTVESLDLSGNPIQLIEDGAFAGSTIAYLYLNNARLTALPSSMKDWLASSKAALELDMNNNWQCDCSALWLGQYLMAFPIDTGPACSASTPYANMKLGLAALQVERDCTSTTSTTTATPPTTPSCPGQPECSVCSKYEAVCHLCPNDLRIPSTVTNLTITHFTCPDLTKLGLIKDNIFTRYHNLEHLNLNNVDIIRFFGAAFQNNSHLLTLSVADNKIKSFGATLFKGVDYLESLNLSNNTISKLIPSSMQTLVALKTLNMAENKLTTLNDHDLDGLSGLETLILAFNPIDNVHSDAFKPLTSVIRIDLKGMKLSQFPDRLFANLTQLKELDASNNMITSVADDSLLGTFIDVLDLSNNQLITAPSAALAQTAAGPKALDLSHNRISQLSSHDFNSLSIERLNLSGNPISQIEDGAFGGSTIGILDLSKTGLRSLPVSLKDVMVSSKTVLVLDMNTEWECNCGALWLGIYLASSTGNTSPVCESGAPYNGTLTDNVPQIEVDCATTAAATTAEIETTKASGSTMLPRVSKITKVLPTSKSSKMHTTATSATPMSSPLSRSAFTARTPINVNIPATSHTATSMETPRDDGQDEMIDAIPIILAAVCTLAVILSGVGVGIAIAMYKKSKNRKQVSTNKSGIEDRFNLRHPVKAAW